MKTILFFLTSFFLGFVMQAQNEGKIIYQETIKLVMEGLPEEMKDMVPPSQSFQKELWFASGLSLYQNVKGEEAEDLTLNSDDGAFQLVIMTDDVEEVFYKDLKNKSTVHQKGIMGKPFVVSGTLQKHPWKITSEKIKYLGYVCQKATLETEDNFIVAWFTSEIPVQAGPARFHGLPGAILMVSVDDGKQEIKALSVHLENIEDDVLKKPKKGKKVSEEEFKKIEAEKLKELEEVHGDHIQIRN